MSSSAVYATNPIVGVASIGLANPNRDGTGIITNVVTASANNTRVDIICIKATSNTTAGMIRFYVANSTVSTLLTEVPVPPTTLGNNIPGFETIIDLYGGRVFPTGTFLKVSTHNAEAFNIIAFGGNF